MLPIPYRNNIPKLLQKTLDSDAGGTAYVNKVDSLLAEWRDETKSIAYLKSPERCPSSLLDELGYYVAAGILKFDSESVKRKKIYEAIERHKRRGSWTNDAKPTIDAITGQSTSLIKDYYTGDWILWGDEADDLDNYTATMGEDGIDDNLGLDLVGGYDECCLAGVICMDIDMSVEQTTAETQILNIDTSQEYSVIQLSNDNFVVVYNNVTAGNHLYFTIFDTALAEVVTPTLIIAGNSQYHQVCKIDQGFVVAYQEGATLDAKFAIYDNAGNLLTSGTSFVGTVAYAKCVSLYGGKWVFAFEDTVGAVGKYYVYDYDTLSASGNFTANDPVYITIDKYLSDSFVIAYSDSTDGNKGKYVVIDEDGTIVIAIATFEANAVGANTAVKSLDSTGLFILAYYDSVLLDDYYLAFQQEAVTAVKTSLDESANTFLNYSIASLQNGNFVILFLGTGGTERLFKIYNKNFEVIQTIYEFTGAGIVANNELAICAFNTENKWLAVYEDAGVPSMKAQIFSGGLGLDQKNQIIESLETDIIPAYMRILLCYADLNNTDKYLIYDDGTLG